MVCTVAEETFNRGVKLFEGGRRIEAMALFEAAMEIERRLLCVERPQARYLSFYGLCLALEKNEIHEALRFCREAVTLEEFNAQLRHNLGRVLMRAGRRREAHDALVRGLSLQPDHPGIRVALKRMGLRRRPVLPFLKRQHPLNVLLGRFRPAAQPAAA